MFRQMYAWGYSTYRRTGTALSVASTTAYHWVSAWGHESSPVAALFGVVKSSGVVGIDEKYVLVPKNDKPAGKMRRWMYVFTPFSDDAQPRIRGKCPLELAGYDISQVPMASLCAGWSPDWPLEVAHDHVPN